MSLDRTLPRWREAGLIAAETCVRIRAFERSQSTLIVTNPFATLTAG